LLPSAGKGEISDIINAAVNFSIDMFKVDRVKRRIILMQMTVFAIVLSRLANSALILHWSSMTGVGDLPRLSFDISK
jgi:hypothetical protein